MDVCWACATICFRYTSIDVALEEIIAAGFDTIDLAVVPGFCPHFDAANSTGRERDDFVRLVRNSGLAVPTVTAVPGYFNGPDVNVQLVLHAAVANLKLAALLNACSLNVNGGLPIDDRSKFIENALPVASGLKRMAQEAARFGLNLNVEVPHRNGLCRTLEEAEFVLDRIAENNVYMLLDVTHVQAGNAHLDDAVRRFAGRIGHVRLRHTGGENILLPPGDGDIQLRPFFAALKQSGYQNYCALEFESGNSLAERRQNLQRAWQAIGTVQGQIREKGLLPLGHQVRHD
jgi:sugar phosphate isomerase/epimerase